MDRIQPILDIQELDYLCQCLMDQTILLRAKVCHQVIERELNNLSKWRRIIKMTKQTE